MDELTFQDKMLMLLLSQNTGVSTFHSSILTRHCGTVWESVAVFSLKCESDWQDVVVFDCVVEVF